MNVGYWEAERLVYQGKTARGLRRMATSLEKLGEHNREKVAFYRLFADSMDDAPKHNGKPCLTYTIYGNCPAWPHG